MGWLRLVGSLKLKVSFAECLLFYRALLQKRPIVLRSLQIVATPLYVPPTMSIVANQFSYAHIYIYIGPSVTQFWDAAESVEAADHVNSAGICILFDLIGYTSDHRQDVLALRPAPIQVHYHGYMGTTGAPWIQVKRYEEHVEKRPTKET